MSGWADGFAVRVFGRDLAARVPVWSGPAGAGGLSVRASKLAWAAEGGPEVAELEVSGLGPALGQVAAWLRCPVEITDSAGELVWWGFVDDVLIGERSGMPAALGVGLGGMTNRVAVRYPAPLVLVGGPYGYTDTAWAQDAESVAEYGKRELRVPLSDVVGDVAATTARDLYLAEAKWPVPRVDFDAPSVYRSARVTCRGWWSTLAWQYYQDLTGQEAAQDGQYVWELGAGAGPLAMAQKVQLAAGVGVWDCLYVAVPLARDGAPADDVDVSLWSDGGVPNVEIARATLRPVAGPMKWYEAALPGPVQLSDGFARWLKIERTSGVNDAANYFNTVIDPMRRYPRGELRRWDGAVWDLLDPNSTMIFRLSNRSLTSTQLDTLLDAGQFIAGVSMAAGTAVSTCPYRDGSRRVLEEIHELLLTGDNLGQRWTVTIGADRVATVGPERASSQRLRIACDGVLYGPNAERMGRAANVAGWWVDVLGAEWWAEVGHVGRASPVFIERCEVDLVKGRRKLAPRVPGKPADEMLRHGVPSGGPGRVWIMAGGRVGRPG